MRYAAPETLKALEQIVEKGHPGDAMYATWALAELDNRRAWALPRLLKGLHGDHTQVEAARVLGYLGPAAKPLIPDLIDLVRTKGGYGPAEVLGAIGPEAKPAVDVLMKEFREDPSFTLAQALARIGHATPETIKALTRELHCRPMPWWKVEAAEALGKLGWQAESALPALRQSAVWEDLPARRAARIAVEQITKSMEEHKRK